MKDPLAGPVGQRYENTWIEPVEAEVTMALQAAFLALESGTADRLVPNPFYQRTHDRPPLTDEDVDRFIQALDEEYDVEMSSYAAHHKARSGAEERTELHRLPPLARRFLAEQVDAIFDKHEHIDQTPPKDPAPPSGPGATNGAC